MEEQVLLLQQNRDISPWDQTDQLIEGWLKQRQMLLITYNQICRTNPTIEENTESTSKLKSLQTFCQILMDYLSAGHFKVFEKLTEAYEMQPELPGSNVVSHKKFGIHNRGISRKIFDKILDTTHVALDFNDKYTDPNSLSELTADLSLLGEKLAHRMTYEDNLIKSYLQVTRH